VQPYKFLLTRSGSTRHFTEFSKRNDDDIDELEALLDISDDDE
jgi:hypothetical protein